MRGRTNIVKKNTNNSSENAPMSFVLTNKRYVNSSGIISHAMIFINCTNYNKLIVTKVKNEYSNYQCDVYYCPVTEADLEEYGDDVYITSGGFRWNAGVGSELNLSKYYMIRLELRGSYSATTQIHFTLS